MDTRTAKVVEPREGGGRRARRIVEVPVQKLAFARVGRALDAAVDIDPQLGAAAEERRRNGVEARVLAHAPHAGQVKDVGVAAGAKVGVERPAVAPRLARRLGQVGARERVEEGAAIAIDVETVNIKPPRPRLLVKDFAHLLLHERIAPLGGERAHNDDPVRAKVRGKRGWRRVGRKDAPR